MGGELHALISIRCTTSAKPLATILCPVLRANTLRIPNLCIKLILPHIPISVVTCLLLPHHKI